ncbi:hypothetical protein KNO81_12280 [Paraburkholderia sediminicola]|nr:hypothetical protein [Paraburkholderia sediminicola]
MKAVRRRVVFVKAITPAPVPEPAHAAAPVEPDDFSWGQPCTWGMFDILVKGLHDSRVSVSDVVRANDAYMCGRPLPHDLIELVVALA